jgi:hypothetical protein
MPWSALIGPAIGLASSFIGSRSASKQADQAEDMRAEQMAFLYDQFDWNKRMANRAFRSQEEEQDYQRKMERLNRRITWQERKFDKKKLGQYNRRLGQERQFEVDRMAEMDREQARLAEMQLQQLLRNQDLAEDERAFAIEQLEQARAVARGERAEDQRLFHEERQQANAERDFALQQFYGSQREARRDQQRDLALRDRMTGQIDEMQRALDRTMRELGPMAEAPDWDEAELTGEIDRRTELYQDDVRQAAEIAASQNEANLIRAGIDSATPGTARRSDVARRIADEMQSARGRAYDDAMGFITGKFNNRMTAHQADLNRRQTALSEIMGVEGAGMDMLGNLPGYRSLSDQGSLANQLRSGVYHRGIGSANDYSAPVNVNSAIYDSMTLTPRLSTYMPTTSRANTAWTNVGSRVFEPYSLNMEGPSTYVGNAGTVAGKMFNAADAFYVDKRDAASGANRNFGNQLSQFLNDVGSTWNDLGSVGRGA